MYEAIVSFLWIIIFGLAYRKPKMNDNQSKSLTKRENKNKRTQQQQQPKQQQQQQKQQVSLSRQEAGSNWLNAIKEQQPSSLSQSQSKNVDINDNNDKTVTSSRKKPRTRNKNTIKFVAMDCEMVGTGPCGTDDMLARVSIVNRNGEVILDKYVKPREKVTNYRTSVSGIRPEDIENGEDFEKVQDEVIEILQDKILVGHAIKHDLRVLYIKHPHALIRDTANYRPLAKLVSNGHTPSLKRVTKAVLGIDIQKGEHSSVEDAKAAMQVYNRLSVEWEKYIQKSCATS